MSNWLILSLYRKSEIANAGLSRLRVKRPKRFSSLQISLPKDKITGGYMGAFDVEVLFLAKKFGFRIDQIPVDWIKILSNKLNIWREPLMMLRDILKVRLYAILGKYEK